MAFSLPLLAGQVFISLPTDRQRAIFFDFRSNGGLPDGGLPVTKASRQPSGLESGSSETVSSSKMSASQEGDGGPDGNVGRGDCGCGEGAHAQKQMADGGFFGAVFGVGPLGAERCGASLGSTSSGANERAGEGGLSLKWPRSGLMRSGSVPASTRPSRSSSRGLPASSEPGSAPPPLTRHPTAPAARKVRTPSGRLHGRPADARAAQAS